MNNVGIISLYEYNRQAATLENRLREALPNMKVQIERFDPQDKFFSTNYFRITCSLVAGDRVFTASGTLSRQEVGLFVDGDLVSYFAVNIAHKLGEAVSGLKT